MGSERSGTATSTACSKTTPLIYLFPTFTSRCSSHLFTSPKTTGRRRSSRAVLLKQARRCRPYEREGCSSWISEQRLAREGLLVHRVPETLVRGGGRGRGHSMGGQAGMGGILVLSYQLVHLSPSWEFFGLQSCQLPLSFPLFDLALMYAGTPTLTSALKKKQSSLRNWPLPNYRQALTEQPNHIYVNYVVLFPPIPT
jgi:hypothetical protein